MNLTTWLNEQARLVRGALVAQNIAEARAALRLTFEDGVRPAMIIRLAVFPLDDTTIGFVRDAFARQAESVFTAGDDLDVEIRLNMYVSLFQDRRRAENAEKREQ